MPTRLPPAKGVAVLNGLVVEIDDETGHATGISRCDRVMD
jgi:calcineurin-like phosphoesterase